MNSKWYLSDFWLKILLKRYLQFCVIFTSDFLRVSGYVHDWNQVSMNESQSECVSTCRQCFCFYSQSNQSLVVSPVVKKTTWGPVQLKPKHQRPDYVICITVEMTTDRLTHMHILLIGFRCINRVSSTIQSSNMYTKDIDKHGRITFDTETMKR